MTNFFTDLVKEASLKPETNYTDLGLLQNGQTKTTTKNILPSSKAMEFPVGEGLIPLQKKQAEKKISQLTETAPPPETNFFADLIKAPLTIPARTTAAIISKKEIQPTTPAERFLYGNEPIKPIRKQYEEAKQATKEYGKLSAPLAATAIFGGAVLDLTPFGGGKKQLAEQLAKETTELGIRKILTKAKVAGDIIDNYVSILAKEKNVKNVNKIIDNIENLQNTTKVARGATPIAQEATKLGVSAEKGIMLQEASKIYKIIKQEGIRDVKGTPVKIVDGVDTFIHEGTGGWVVSEATTGRYIADSVSKEGAIAKAKFNIANVGETKFKQLLSENKLPTQAVKGVEKTAEKGMIPQELQPFAQEARKYSNKSQFLEKIANVDGKGKSGSEVYDLLKNAEKAWDSQGIGFGKDVIRDIPVKDIKLAERPLAVKPKAGRSINDPIEITYINGEPTLVDGRHRLDQAIANGEKTIKAKVSGQLTDFYTQAVKGGEVKPIINISKLNIPEQAKQKVVAISEQIKPELEKTVRKTLTNDEVLEAAQRAEVLRGGASREATLKSEAALLKTRQHLSALAEGKDVSREFINTLRIVSQEATKRGRELQALGISADPSLGTIKTKIIRELLQIGKSTDEILSASKGVDFTDAKQVTDFYRKFVKPTLPELIDEYRYINLLSSPKTHIVNAFSNLLQVSLLRPTTRLASGIVDIIGSKLTGKAQEYYISQVPAYYKGAFNSLGDATKNFIDAIRGKSLIYRPDIKQIPTGNKFLRPFQIIPKVLEASDVFFRTLGTGGEMEALLKKGVPEAEAIEKSAKTAEELVFRKALDPSNKTGQGALLSGIDKLTSSVYQLRNVPGVKWFVPFVQTPMNILKQGIEYSPLGLATLKGNTNKIEQLGKAMVGSTIFTGVGWLALNDKTTWAVPTNKKEKDAFYAAGMQPYSIKIGDKWVTYSRLGPIGYPMAMAAGIKFYTEQNPDSVTETTLEKTKNVLSGIAKFFSDQSYVEGLGDLLDTIQGDVTAITRAASNIPSQLIPLSSLQRWVANLIDPVYRKAEKELSIDGIIKNLEKGLPFLSTNLEPYITPTEEESRRQYPFFQAVSPVGVTKESPEMLDYFKTLQEVSKEKKLITKNKEETQNTAQKLYDKLKILPREQAKEQFNNLIKENPDVASEINVIIEKEKKGFSYKDDFLISLGVENGMRARAIKKELDKLKTKEEKRLYYQELINKKVITKNVNEQLKSILGGQ